MGKISILPGTASGIKSVGTTRTLVLKGPPYIQHTGVSSSRYQVFVWHGSFPCCPATLPCSLVWTQTVKQRWRYHNAPLKLPIMSNMNRVPEHTLKWPHHHHLGMVVWSTLGTITPLCHHCLNGHTGMLGLHIAPMPLGLLAPPRILETHPCRHGIQSFRTSRRNCGEMGSQG